MSEKPEINYQVVLSFNEGDARANVQITNLRQADFEELRKKIGALEQLLLIDRKDQPHDHP